MVLVDAIYVNNSGGLVLLKYLIEELEGSELDIFYILDDRTVDVFAHINKNKIVFLSNSLHQRWIFYFKNKHRFDKVLCFGNLPPPMRLSVPVLVYFHQLLFLSIPNDFSLKDKVVYNIKQKILSFYKGNASTWITQSQLVKSKLSNKYFSRKFVNIEVIPFYPPLDFLTNKDLERKENSFLYVSNSGPHKNHNKLIEAFCNAYDMTQKGSLIVTVPTSATNLCKLILEKNKQGYPINNVGFINRKELVELYLTHEYLIFPSLDESFGLGLVEAIDGGCKILVSELPYAYQVCEPSLTFNPNIKESIKSSIIMAIEKELPESKKIISNDINQLISLLSE